MPEPADANDLAQLAVRVGLIDEPVARELLYEFDNPKGSPVEFARLLERKGLITPLLSGKLLKGETDGYFLGGYRLLYKIASGSFGRVYRGDDRSGRVVAVKVLRRRWLDTPKRIESFEREGRLGMTLDHPNIVRILNVGKDAATGSHFIVMDFVEGGNLRDILQIRKTIEPDEALRILEESVNGLAYAYARGLTHRDIKPSNILLGTDKVAKLVDFGLAEATEVDPHEVLVVGVKTEKDERPERTVDYAGLEKATGAPSGDVRSDIYFLGHVLYEMVTGKPLLVPTKNPHMRMQRRRFEEVEVALEKAARDLPPPLVRLIAKAVALEPGQRFQTPTAFYEAIRKCRQDISGIKAGGNSRRADGPLTIFVVEPNPKLQAVFREKLREYGFERVLISIDPEHVVKRYQSQPYHACLIDAGALGREGVEAFKRVIRQADADQRDLAAVVILNDDQRAWVDDAMSVGKGEVIVRPLTLSVLHEVLANHLPELAPDKSDESTY